MIEISSIDVFNNLSLDYLLIQIKIKNTVEDLDNYRFDLYRSNSPADGYELIVSNLAEFEFRDFSINLRNPYVIYYYKVNIKNMTTGQTQMSNVVGHAKYSEPDQIALAVLHANDIYLDVVNNELIHILLRKRFGQRCSECWDDIRLQSRSEECLSCYGSGFTGGYFVPIKTQMSFLSGMFDTQQLVEATDVGEQEAPIQIWIPNYPLVKANDIVVDGSNRRYLISRVQPTTKSGFILRQILILNRLPMSHIAYKIPMEVR